MIVVCESLPKNRSEAIRPVVAAGFSPLPHKIFSVASSMRYVKFSEQVPIRALDARRFFAALPRVRARLAELRAARFATLHIVNQQQTRERRARPPRRVKLSPPGGRMPSCIRAVSISASEDEP
jgi:hypothetical protein